MKFLLLLFLSAATSIAVFSQNSDTPQNENLREGDFYKSTEVLEEEFKAQYGESLGGTGYKPFKRFEWFWKSRLTEEGKIPSTEFLQQKYMEYLKEESSYPKNTDVKNSDMDWKPLGPIGVPSHSGPVTLGNGRVNAMAIDPNDPNTLWAGAAGGGIWKSTDRGSSWSAVGYDDFMSLAISHIAIDPRNSNVIYVATGDVNSIVNLNGNTVGGVDDFNVPSIGLLKSTNGGASWSNTGFAADQGALFGNSTSFISTIIIHPENSNRIILGTDDGLLESFNGGVSFEKIADGTFRDIKINPVNTDILHCGYNNSNSYRFILGNFSLNNRQFIGNQRSIPNTNRIEIATTPADNGNTLYAVVSRSDNRMEGFYKSTDMGMNWVRLNTNDRDFLVRDPNGNRFDSGQGFYDLALAVNPTDENEVYIGGINIWKTEDGGQSFGITAFWLNTLQGSGLDDVHADIHYLVFSEDGSTIYATNDGGISASTDQGETWDDITSNLMTTQYYDISVERVNGRMWVIGGAQDNGTSLWDSERWRIILGGDGMRSQIAVLDNHYYVSNQNGNIYRVNLTNNATAQIGGGNNRQDGERSDWVVPFVVSPHDERTIYAGYENLWRSTNRGNNWERITSRTDNNNIEDVVVSQTDPNTIYYTVSGGNSRLYKTTDGGNSWTIIAPSGTVVSGFVTDLYPDPYNSEILYYTVGGYNSSNKVWKVTGDDFENISNGLPNFSVNAVFVDRNNRMYAGTDIGVYVRDGSTGFRPFKDGMPNVVVTDFESPGSQTELYAATYGSGAWVKQLVDCSNVLQPGINVSGNIELCPNDSIELTYTGAGNIEWNTGEKTRSIWVKEPGDYYAVNTAPNGCVAASDIATVVESGIQAPTILGVPENSEFCEGDTITLRVLGLTYDKYFWNGEEGERFLNVSEPGEYVLTVEEEGGCSITLETIVLTTLPLPNKPTVTFDSGTMTLTSTFGNRYQWYREGKALDGATTRNYTPIWDGNYTVETYSTAGCGNMSDPVAVVGTRVELIEISESIIYPNPAQNTISFKNLPASIMDLEIYDLNGKIVFANNDVSQNSVLNLNLASGSYIAVFKEGDKGYTTNLTIK